MRLQRLLAAALLFGGLFFGLTTGAHAQCNGRLHSGNACANAGASEALGQDTTLSALFDKAFGTTPVTFLLRGSSVWTNAALSGDCALSSVGAITCTKTNGSSLGALATVTPGANVATALGNATNASGGVVTFSGALGTPASGTLTNATGLPISTGVSGLGANVATALASALNGSGAAAATTSPTLVTPVLGVAAATSITASNGTANGVIFKDVEATVGGSITEDSNDNVFFTAGNGATCSPNCQVAIRDAAGNPEFGMVNGSATPTTATAYLVDLSTIDATTTAAGGSSMAFAGGVGIAKRLIVGTSIQTGNIGVGSLPTCNAAAKGTRYFVTNATSVTYHATAVTGGTNSVGVTCDGTNWYISANDNAPQQMQRKFA